MNWNPVRVFKIKNQRFRNYRRKNFKKKSVEEVPIDEEDNTPKTDSSSRERGLYTKAKGGNNTYNDAYRYFVYNLVPERFKDDKKGERNWKKDTNKKFFMSKLSTGHYTKSKLCFRSKSGNVIIPFKKEIDNLLKLLHCGINDGLMKHNGVNTVLADLKDQNIYWAGMIDDVKKFIEICPQCNEEMILKPIKTPKVIISHGPFYRYIADLWQIPTEMSLLASDKTHPQFKYVMLCVDHFSKFTWGVLLEDKEASTLVCELRIIFNQYKVPKIFQSDNGKEFRNNSLNTLCENLGIKRIFGSVRHPQSQGAVEKLNDFLGK